LWVDLWLCLEQLWQSLCSSLYKWNSVIYAPLKFLSMHDLLRYFVRTDNANMSFLQRIIHFDTIQTTHNGTLPWSVRTNLKTTHSPFNIVIVVVIADNNLRILSMDFARNIHAEQKTSLNLVPFRFPNRRTFRAKSW